MRLQEKDEEMKVISRRTQLEAKSLKSQLASEQAKVKDLFNKYDAISGEVCHLVLCLSIKHNYRVLMS